MDSIASLLLRLSFDAAELRRRAIADRAPLTAAQERQLMNARLDLQSVASLIYDAPHYTTAPEEA